MKLIAKIDRFNEFSIDAVNYRNEISAESKIHCEEIIDRQKKKRGEQKHWNGDESRSISLQPSFLRHKIATKCTIFRVKVEHKKPFSFRCQFCLSRSRFDSFALTSSADA